MNQEKVKVIIIGSGPAGLTAALYTARAQLNPVVLTGKALGGQVALTYHIENYPGFPQGVSGQVLAEAFTEQAQVFGAVLEYDSAIKVDFSRPPFRVVTEEKEYLAEAVIITSGADPKYLGVPGEKEYTGRGVSYCATCDGHFFKEKEVIVVGGGDSAVEEGLFLTRFAKKVTIVHRRDALRASAILQQRAFANPKIQFIWNSVVTEIRGKEFTEEALLKNVKTQEVFRIKTDGIFIFIGYVPNTEIFKGQLQLDENGYIVVDAKMNTNIKGIFAAGEVADPYFRQVVTSAGMGAAAAMQAIRYLDNLSSH